MGLELTSGDHEIHAPWFKAVMDRYQGLVVGFGSTEKRDQASTSTAMWRKNGVYFTPGYMNA